MNAKRVAPVLLAFVALVAAFSNGCRSATITATLTVPTVETVTDILNRALNIHTVKLDEVITQGTQVTTVKVWMKNNKIRLESTQQGLATVTLIDTSAKTTYVYIPSAKTASRTEFDSSVQTIADRAKGVITYNPVALRQEVLDRKDCIVIQYEQPQWGTVREWVWKENGFPIRIEPANAELPKIECMNIDFNEIPDSMFEVPTDVKVSE
jgi:hypothetical protein